MVRFAHERRSRRAAQVSEAINGVLSDKAFAEFSWLMLGRGQPSDNLDARPEQKLCHA